MTDVLRDEVGRVALLSRLAVLDTPREARYDHITRLVTLLVDVPNAYVSFVDRDRQWCKAGTGMGLIEVARRSSLCSVAITQTAPLLVEDATLDPRFAQNEFVLGEPHLRSYIGVPLRAGGGYQVGTLCGIDLRPRTFTPTQVSAMRELAVCVENELALRLRANTDDLTGLLNRGEWTARLRAAVARADEDECAVALLDLDHFKRVNDRYGHDAGDDVLRSVAAICRDTLPDAEVGRLGGEEFAILAPGVSVDGMAERLRGLNASIGALSFVRAPGLVVTGSFGVTGLGGGDGEGSAALKRADLALYRAKAAGRNQVVVWEDDAPARAFGDAAGRRPRVVA